ncbi:hypothetical protein [Streptomyces sp. NPDC029004]|uniref:hypothetical protein n=1 Tax=Streptomyces sp. NPDC029004 TaxID=3154490 RepID=UPI0033D53F05
MREPEPLGVPLADVLLLGGTVAPGPGGRPALWNVSTGRPACLTAVDPATGEQLVSAPLADADGAWALTSAPDGVYAGTYSNAHLYRWRPGAGDEAEDLGQPLDGESFVWSLACDEDGAVWGGTFPGGRVFRFDPAAKEYTDFGQVVAGQSYVRSIACAGGKVYSGSYAAAHIAELDPATGSVTELPMPPSLDSAESRAVYDLDAHDGRLYARIGSDLPGPLFVYDLQARAWTDEIPGAHGLTVAPPDPGGGIHLVQHGELHRYDPATRQLTSTGLTFTGKMQCVRSFGWAELLLDDWPGQSVVGTLSRGEMFRYNPATGAYAITDTGITKSPIEILALGVGDGETLYAGGFLNGGLASVNTATGATEFHRFGQTECILPASDGSVWLGLYPEARLYRYRPDRPWNSPEYSPGGPPGTPVNPEPVLNLAPHLQMRAKCLVEADGKIVVGTVPEGDRLGGGLAIHDPADGTYRFVRHVVEDQSVFCLTAHEGVVYGGASITGGLSTTEYTRESGAVFAWDMQAGEKLWELEPVPTERSVSAVAIGPDERLWGLAGYTLFAVDLGSQQVVRQYRLGSRSAAGSIVISRERLYVSVDNALIYRVDPYAEDDEPALVVGFVHRRLCVHSDGSFSLNRGPELFRVVPRY